MPIIWRYLLKNYFQLFFLCLFSLVGILYVMRFKEIADFAALSAGGYSIFLFSLLQLPYVLPDAIPISCLISSIILMQKMSRSGELTALRASGMGLKVIFYPIVLAGVIVSLLNFSIVSEVGPKAKALSKDLQHRMMSVNPFYLFNKISEGKITNAYVEMRALRGGKKAKDVLLIMNNRTNSRLGIMTAKELQIEGDLLSGKDVTIISSVDSKLENNYDHLVIENQVTMSTKAESLSQLLDDADWHMGIEYLPLRMVLAKAALKKGSLFYSSLGLDIARRFSIGFCPLLFTLLGAAFGLEVGRNLTRKGIFWSVVLAALYLCCFLSGKSMKETPPIGWFLFFIPYPIIFLFALRSLRLVSRGLE